MTYQLFAVDADGDVREITVSRNLDDVLWLKAMLQVEKVGPGIPSTHYFYVEVPNKELHQPW